MTAIRRRGSRTASGRPDRSSSTEIYHYPNDQPATTLWYHDHALGTTRLNVYAGLAGFYLLRDNARTLSTCPSGAFEIPLIIQDRRFNADGSLFYPVFRRGGDPDKRRAAVWIPEFFGDTVLVNGKVWPFLEVEPRKYRFRHPQCVERAVLSPDAQ